VCGAVVIGLIAAFVAFGVSPYGVQCNGADEEMVVFTGDWYYWSVIGATLLASCVPFGCKPRPKTVEAPLTCDSDNLEIQ
jgi:hypothetical protein